MAFATTLRQSAIEALSKDIVESEYAKLKGILTLAASNGEFEIKYQFSRTFNQENRDELKEKLVSDGLAIDVDYDTGFLIIRW